MCSMVVVPGSEGEAAGRLGVVEATGAAIVSDKEASARRAHVVGVAVANAEGEPSSPRIAATVPESEGGGRPRTMEESNMASGRPVVAVLHWCERRGARRRGRLAASAGGGRAPALLSALALLLCSTEAYVRPVDKKGEKIRSRASSGGMVGHGRVSARSRGRGGRGLAILWPARSRGRRGSSARGHGEPA
ncbi:hypothetical protein Dimus_021000 [Dionaea muscipula]